MAACTIGGEKKSNGIIFDHVCFNKNLNIFPSFPYNALDGDIHPPPRIFDPSLPILFTPGDLEEARSWILTLRKDYSPNSDIWNLCRDWESLKDSLLQRLNDGSYQFSPLTRYEFSDGTLSLWSSLDMIVLKLITKVLGEKMSDHIPLSCYHVKGHGGLKKAVADTYEALSDDTCGYTRSMRSDIRGYYESIRFDVLMTIIESYVTHPILLILIRKALYRTETKGGLFYEYTEKSIPKGSPLSPLLGAIALIPLDLAISRMNDIFYARFMDDWVVLTKSKTALRKVVKITHEVLKTLKLELHPKKTYIGKISHGFNFLAYYMDGKRILPAKESIRRFHERITVLYEHSQDKSPAPQGRQNTRKSRERARRGVSNRGISRDISVYQVNEEAPTEPYFQTVLARVMGLAMDPDTLGDLRRYLDQWTRWLRVGLSSITAFERSVQAELPGIFSCWTPGSLVLGSTKE